MEVAVITGILVGTILAKIHIDSLFLLYYLRKYRNEDSFLTMFDAFDSEEVYEVIKTNDTAVESYAGYLRLHQACKYQAWQILKNYRSSVFRTIGFLYIAAVVAALLFQEHLLFFTAGLLVAHIWFMIDRRVIKKRSGGYYRLVVVRIILEECNEQSSSS